MTTAEIPRHLYSYFEVEALLGKGAMGAVYLARDSRNGQRVALKTVSPRDPDTTNPMEQLDYLGRMKREAEISTMLSHPNIVGLHEASYENDQVRYIAMEYVEGETLEAMIKREGQLPYDRVEQITSDLLDALSHAHSKGIVHRDIKPANILLTRSGTAKLADFGIARPEDSQMTMAGQVLGTPMYTSPENIMGNEITPRSDLFSIGVVVYEMLTGKKPFFAPKMQNVLMLVVTQPAAPLVSLRPGLPDSWENFVQQLLRKKPEERFPTASDALAALQKAVAFGTPPPSSLEEEQELIVPEAAKTAQGEMRTPVVEPPPPTPSTTPAAALPIEARQTVSRAPLPPSATPKARPSPVQAKPISLWERIKKMFGS